MHQNSKHINQDSTLSWNIGREPNVRIFTKNVILESERYTVEILYHIMCKHCLIRNHCIAIRNELHFDRMHACCMIQCWPFTVLILKLYTEWQVNYTRLTMMVSQLNTFTQYMPEYKTHRVEFPFICKMNRHVLFTEKIFNYLSVLVFSYSWQMSSVNISSKSDGLVWEFYNMLELLK